MTNPVSGIPVESKADTPSNAPKPSSASRLLAARTRSATINFPSSSKPNPNGFPPDIMKQLKQQLSVRDATKVQEEKKGAPDAKPPVRRTASFSVNSAPQVDAYWQGVYKRTFFNNEKEFAQVAEYAVKKLTNGDLDRAIKGICTLIKNGAYLLKQVPTHTVSDAIRETLSKRTIELTMPGIDMNKAIEALDSVLEEIQEDLYKTS